MTGSNAKLLSSEIASSLRGRSLTFEVYPLSLREYLNFKDIEIDLYSSASLAHIKNAMDSFLVDGGFPETLFLEQKYTTQMLQGYFSVMIYKDLIERYAISNTVALKFFLKRIIASSTKQISINKIYNELKSSGIKIGKNSLYDFLDYVQTIYLALTLHRYDASLVNQEFGEKKIYSIDIGLTNAIAFRFSDNRGKALESAVFLELKRRGEEIYYYSDKSSECDFIVSYNGAVIEAIQVSYEMSQSETKKREIKGVLSACKAFGLSKGMIITYDEEDETVEDGVVIEVIPLYRWVLER